MAAPRWVYIAFLVSVSLGFCSSLRPPPLFEVQEARDQRQRFDDFSLDQGHNDKNLNKVHPRSFPSCDCVNRDSECECDADLQYDVLSRPSYNANVPCQGKDCESPAMPYFPAPAYQPELVRICPACPSGDCDFCTVYIQDLLRKEDTVDSKVPKSG